MLSAITTAITPVLGAAPGLVLAVAIGAIGVGGLLCLAADDDEPLSAFARQALGLVVGGWLAGGLAQAVAGIAPIVLPLG